MSAAEWFTPSQLADWQINKKGGDVRVELPALQRGAVWRPHQTELLWDSLLRGFPIGSLLLAPYHSSRGRRKARNQVDSDEEPTFHLLDGQQRWDSITIGFLDIWRGNAEKFQSVLWIDLDPPKSLTDGRQFVFRLITRSHPWGYNHQNPTQRLLAPQRRDAFIAFEEIARATGKWQDHFRPGVLTTSLAFPWDANAPVPVPFLIDAIRNEKEGNGVWERVDEALSSLAYWKVPGELPVRVAAQKTKTKRMLQEHSKHMDDIFHGMRDNLGLNATTFYHIPALIAQMDPPASSDKDGEIDKEDPLLTLFVRLNVAGTRPTDDELRFSMLKSVCPEVQLIAERLGRNLMSPAKLVTLLSRLILGRRAKELPGEPDLARFRRLVHKPDAECPDFMGSIRDYLGLDADGKVIESLDGQPEGRAGKLIEAANDLLGSGSWGLPAVSISNLATGSGSSPFFFLLLAWLDRLLEQNKLEHMLTALGAEERRLVAGALTTLAWFSDRPGDCLLKLWKRLGEYDASHGLEQFFSVGMMRECIFIEGRRALLPVLPPSCLQEAIRQTLTRAASFDAGEPGLWAQDWSRWRSLDLEVAADAWFSELKLPKEQRLPGATQGLPGRLWEMKELLHYAQREQIRSWFRDYDPASPDQLEDTDRPWDYDHIFPGSYGGVNGLPPLIKEWGVSIGNLRIWPFDANRALGDDYPAKKLEAPIRQEGRYGLTNGMQVRLASRVDEKDYWSMWRGTTPGGARPNWRRYLADPRNPDESVCRGVLVRALSARWVGLYFEWYTQLCVSKLFQPAS